MQKWIVVPLYNESLRFDTEYWNQIVSMANCSFLFANDGSTDNTGNLIDGFTEANVEVLHFSKNAGKAETIRKSFKFILDGGQSNTKFIGYLDADRAFDPLEVVSIINDSTKSFQLESLDAIWMSRVKLGGSQVERSPFRHFFGRVIASYIGIGISKFPYDTQCGFKIFKATSDLSSILDEPFETKWFVDIEIMNRLSSKMNKWMNIDEVPLNYWKEIGNSKIGWHSILRVLFEIFTVKKRLIQVERVVRNGLT